MISRRVARRYARALFDAAVEKKTLDLAAKELGRFASLYGESEELRQALTSPSVDTKAKIAIIGDVGTKLRLSPMVREFLLAMLERHRLDHVGAVYDEVEGMRDAAQGRVKVEARSAQKLSLPQTKRLETILQKLLGKQIILTTVVDETLIGGMALHIGSVVIDGSVRGRLDKLRTTIGGH